MKKIMIFLSSLVLLFSITACNAHSTYECNPIFVFDTTVTMVFYDQDDYKDYYNVIKKEFNKISLATNDFASNEEENSLYDLNQKRTVESEILTKIIKKSIEYKEITNGYYNPFIGRLTHKWKELIKKDDFSESDILSSSYLENELNIMNNTSVSFDGNKITLIGDGNIDLGGITKGYALEWAKKYLEENNVKKYYINCGSSSIYIGDKNINVSLRKPYENSDILSFDAKNIGIGTSSPKYQYKELNNIKYHHLLNPFTGLPSNIYDSINIISENNLENDIFSTALFSMPLDEVKEFIEQKNINILLYKDNSILYQRYEI